MYMYMYIVETDYTVHVCSANACIITVFVAGVIIAPPPFTDDCRINVGPEDEQLFHGTPASQLTKWESMSHSEVKVRGGVLR